MHKQTGDEFSGADLTLAAMLSSASLPPQFWLVRQGRLGLSHLAPEAQVHVSLPLSVATPVVPALARAASRASSLDPLCAHIGNR